MGFANIRRPPIIPRLVLENVLFWNKRTSDNIDAINNKLEYVELNVTHNAATLFSNPRRDELPIGFIPTNSVVIATDSTETPALGLLSFALDLSRTDGQLGITPKFNMPVRETMALVMTASQSVANGSLTTLTWGGVCISDEGPTDPAQGVFSWSAGAPTILSILKPGRFDIEVHGSWAASATGGRGLYIASSGGTRHAAQEIAANPIGGWYTQNDLILLGFEESTTQDLVVHGYQNSGAALNMNGNGTLITRPAQGDRAYVRITRVDNFESYSATVRGFLLYA